jgi:hypothetical protein
MARCRHCGATASPESNTGAVFVLATAFSLFAILLLVVGALIVFRQGGPSRALTREQAVRVLEDVLAGKARDADWLIFMALPIRHDPLLVEVRLRCMEIEKRWFVGSGTHRDPLIFRRDGLSEIATLLRWLRKETDSRLL